MRWGIKGVSCPKFDGLLQSYSKRILEDANANAAYKLARDPKAAPAVARYAQMGLRVNPVRDDEHDGSYGVSEYSPIVGQDAGSW